MRVMVTGSSGFIGGHLLRALEGHKVVPYDLRNFTPDDVLNVEQLRWKMEGCDAVVHLAARTSQAESVEKPGLYYLHNVIGTENVVEAASQLGGVRVVFASSAAAYSPLDNPYALSKYAAESVVKRARSQGEIAATVLRIFNVYGPGDNPAKVIPTFIRQAKAGEPMTVFGDGRQTRDFVHVRDVASSIKRVLEGLAVPDHDVGTARSICVLELASLVQVLVGRAVGIEFADARAEIRHSCASSPWAIGMISLVGGLRELI